jgi:hypothetical protein
LLRSQTLPLWEVILHIKIGMPQDVLQNHPGKPPKSKRINIPRVQSNAESESHNFQSHSFRSDMDGDNSIPPLFRWLLKHELREDFSPYNCIFLIIHSYECCFICMQEATFHCY